MKHQSNIKTKETIKQGSERMRKEKIKTKTENKTETGSEKQRKHVFRLWLHPNGLALSTSSSFSHRLRLVPASYSPLTRNDD